MKEELIKLGKKNKEDQNKKKFSQLSALQKEMSIKMIPEIPFSTTTEALQDLKSKLKVTQK